MVSPMRRPSQVFAAVAACGVIVAAAAFITLAPPSTAVETQVCNPQPGQAPADAKVILQDRQYKPSEVDLPAANMSVCWEHDDGQTPHTITFDGSATVKDPPDSNPGCTDPTNHPENCFREGQTAYKVIFASAGTFTYHCRVFPDMKGVVKVAGGGAPVRTTTTRPATTATTKAPSTATTVGTLSETTTTTAAVTSTTSASTTSSSIALSTATTAPGTAAAKKSDDDDPSGVLEGIGVLLLAAVVIALIPSWRRLT
jgi:plastocyanin